ncbi:hypothetical protein A5714_16965 [Mycobacterium sp. E2462]|uniref:hypothetical protein n=1 Tax=Mycobacterium sp. E2462 TaxID=1834133 RepID=UPI0007FFD2C5|nr:hypothetical protein [Mycobacterium sp. E2462]OBI11038.1 hypothetical protein A5714_16965 [Mycobacterium sp. E2462]
MSIDPPPFPGQPPGYGPHYGWSPGPPAAPPKPAPRKHWYAVGAGLLAVGIILGATVFGVGLVTILSKRPAAEHTFGSGGSTTVHIDAGATKVIYVDNDEGSGRHRVHCDVDGGSTQRPRLQRYDGNMTLNHWDAFFTIDAVDSGDYTIACTGAPADTFGVGDKPSTAAFVATILGGLAGVGIAVAGIVTLVVTAVLRHRRATTPWYPGFTTPG